jgi:hypothetical protein
MVRTALFFCFLRRVIGTQKIYPRYDANAVKKIEKHQEKNHVFAAFG